MAVLYVYSVFVGVIVGSVILFVMHYLGDIPFPWQWRTMTKRSSEPDTTALSECFNKVSNKEQIHLVMGNISSFVCEQKPVLDSLSKCLEKGVKIKLIHGPQVDRRSKEFIGALKKSKDAELYTYPEDPPLHFRVLVDSEGKSKEVYVEEPHDPYQDLGYRHIVSHRVSKDYEDIFQKMTYCSKRTKLAKT